MPILAVNLGQNVFVDILRLVDRGTYSSPQQFLEVAAQNQIALEHGTSVDDIVGRGKLEVGSAPANYRPVGTGPSNDDALSTESLVANKNPRSGASGSQQTAGGNDPSVQVKRRFPAGRRQAEAPGPAIAEEMLARLSLERWVTAPPSVTAAEPRPIHERIFGQVNKALPIVFAARWFGVEASLSGEWPRLSEAADRLGDDAATLGSSLDALDKNSRHKRDDILATGLPRRGNSASKDRYVSQFVARTTRSGAIFPGAICQYSLASVQEDRLVLTDRGLNLAKLPNPILDGGGRKQPTLSGPERELLVRCVLDLVPGEALNFTTLLSAILHGHDTPTDLVAAMRKSLPDEGDDAAFRAQVSGVIARAAELDLIRRRWEGRFVKYDVTDSGKSLLVGNATGHQATNG